MPRYLLDSTDLTTLGHRLVALAEAIRYERTSVDEGYGHLENFADAIRAEVMENLAEVVTELAKEIEDEPEKINRILA